MTADEFTVPAPSASEHEILQRQLSLNLSLPERGVAIVGCGGVGSWIALFLALAGVRNLWLFDPDTVSESNLNRIPLPMETVNVGKSEALCNWLKQLRPSCQPTALKTFSGALATSIHLEKEVDWLVCSTDTWASRKEAHSWANAIGVSYLEAAAEGEIGSITDAPAEWATPEEALPGYQSVPVWVGPCVAAAMMAAAHILHARMPRTDQVLRMGWGTEGISFFDSLSKPPTLPAIAPPTGQRWRIEFQRPPNETWQATANVGLRGTFATEELAHRALLEYPPNVNYTYRVSPSTPPTEEAA